MRKLIFALTCAVALMFGAGARAVAQTSATQPPAASQPLQGSPQAIDQELEHLTKDLELTPDQQRAVRGLLQEHHDKLQALFDAHPTQTRQQLAPQIHAISDQTHREIHALLTAHQQELEQAMIQREHSGPQHRL